MTPAFLGTAYYISEWAVRLVMLVYIPQRRTAAAARTWLLLIFLLPWPGLVVYAVFGRIRVPRLRRDKLARAGQVIRQVEAKYLAERVAVGAVPLAYESASRLAYETGDFVPFPGNRIKLLDDYASSIAKIIDDIDSAAHHVHALFYIYCDDATGNAVTDAIVRAAGRGVQCRLLLDAVGAKDGLGRLATRLRAAGVDVRAALPVGVFLRTTGRFDLRNHRKIVTVDGRVAYTGSQNIVDAMFVPGYPNEELMARVSGPVVAQLEAVFLTDWFLETDQRLDIAQFAADMSPGGESVAQVQPSGPGYPAENTRDLLISLMYAARESVVITTPYFIPDEPFLQALRAAATRGVEVRLVVSKHANQPFSQFAQRSYYEELLAAGVKVHLYRPRFLHAKHVSVDGQVVVLGTTNIDIRSFALNAEVSLVVFDPAVAADLARIQARYFSDSDVLVAAEWNRRPLLAKVAQNVARLADSLL
ncbi:MAG TPA: cardiolipin synthase [Gemmatimonadaceae bacterium]|nr:cardiolipin synthase [Gemmatimonadaceae bacterium]